MQHLSSVKAPDKAPKKNHVHISIAKISTFSARSSWFTWSFLQAEKNHNSILIEFQHHSTYQRYNWLMSYWFFWWNTSGTERGYSASRSWVFLEDLARVQILQDLSLHWSMSCRSWESKFGIHHSFYNRWWRESHNASEDTQTQGCQKASIITTCLLFLSDDS